MKLGCCLLSTSCLPEIAGSEHKKADQLLLAYKIIKDAGYAYMECGVGMLMDLSEEELDILAEASKKGYFQLEACNCFIPGNFCVPDSKNLPQLTAYVEEAMRRMSLFDVESVVFGSGAARNLPGKDKEAEMKAMEAFLRMCNEYSSKYGITVGIEPLGKEDCNVFNYMNEAAQMVRKLDLPYIKLLPDSYQMAKVQDDLTSIEAHADIICHVHVAEDPDRTYPGKNGGAYVREFAKHLCASNYNGRVSVECVMDDLEKECKLAYTFMTECLK